MEYDDFRIEVAPHTEPGSEGRWRVRILDCPDPAFIELEDLNQAVRLTPANLQLLRSPNGHPHLAPAPPLVQHAGSQVWDTLMGPNVRAAFFALRTSQKEKQRGLRVVTVLKGNEGGGSQIQPIDMPIEAVYHDVDRFLTNDDLTPFVRSFFPRSDYSATPFTAPLRVLLVTACPEGMPLSDITTEATAIREALEPLSGNLDLRACNRATVNDVLAAVTGRTFDIVHFICHGGRGAGADSYIYLHDADGLPKSVDAATLNELLRNTGMRLLIFSACSSAAAPAAIPVGNASVPYHASAFSGIAQSLIRAHRNLGAVVAMQFDFEAVAATTFSRTFYQQLLAGNGLEGAVAAGRRAVFANLSVQHRAWVTPVIYSRCKAGKLFDLSLLPSTTLSQAEEIRLGGLNMVGQEFLKMLEQMCHSPGAPQLLLYQQMLANLNANRGQAMAILKQTVRAAHGSAPAGSPLELPLTLVLPAGTSSHLATLKARLPLGVMATAATRSAGAASIPCPLAMHDGVTEIAVDTGEVDFPADGLEHSLVSIEVQLSAGIAPGRLAVEIVSCEIATTQGHRLIACFGGSIFVETT